MRKFTHQYIERETGVTRDELLHGDRLIRALYSDTLERAPALCRILSCARLSSALAYFNYDSFIGARLTGAQKFLRAWGVDFDECVDAVEVLNTPRKIFERRIRYWERRPMPEAQDVAVCPADSRALVGALAERSLFFVKEKFFAYDELFGADNDEGKRVWRDAFLGGEFAVFRLTPEKYHYTHTPVAGLTRDFYEVGGRYHSCNPSAQVALITPHSKNRRAVTIIDTDVKGGTGVGLVAMIEVAALMIARIESCYSAKNYDAPQRITKNLFVERGQPKALFRPGGSTVILLFQKNRVQFADDLAANVRRQDVKSRFSKGFGQTLVETDVRVRSLLATRMS